MRKLVICFIIISLSLTTYAKEGSSSIIKGFDGGMMVHTGYLKGNISPIGYKAEGCPMGIGGVIRLHIGDHFRVGTEGYVSTLNQLENGSYIKYGWGGLLADYRWQLGKFFPYIGLTVGGGLNTDYLMFKAPETAWGQVGNAIYHKQSFLAIDPFIGCDYALAETVHLTLKMDWLNILSKNSVNIPQGPRLYFGFIFYH